MSALPMRSPSVTSCQSTSSCLPSPPNSFSHSLRDSVGEMSDTLSPLRERLDSGLTSPRLSPGISRSRPYARHPSPSGSPFVQGTPISSSSPRSSSPLAGLPQPPVSHSPRPISPANGPMQGSPASIHSIHSQSQYHPHRSLFHSNQSHFFPSQSSPLQAIPSPRAHYTRTKPLIQQSFGSPYTMQVSSSPPDDIRHRHISFSVESRPHPAHGSPTLPGHSSVQDGQLAVMGDSTPLNKAPLRWWGGRGAWVEDWDKVVQHSQGVCDLCTAHSSGGEELDGFLHSGHGTPSSFGDFFGRGGNRAGAFLDEEIRASFDSAVDAGVLGYTDPLELGFIPAPPETKAGDKVEGIPVPRTAPVPIPPPVAESFGIHNIPDGSVCHIHLHGSVGRLSDGSIPVQCQEPSRHCGQRCDHTRGHNRRLSDASTHSSVSYISCMSGPSQSQSQSPLVSPSQSHTSTFPSLASLGIGIEKVEREELRTRTFWARSRKNSGSTTKRRSNDLSPSLRGHSEDVVHGRQGRQRSPSVRSDEGLSEGVRVGDIRTWEAIEPSDADPKSLGAHTQEKETAKHGSMFFRSNPKQVDILDKPLHRERYERTEKCVSLAITSILPATTIARLSPIGEALVKARESVKYVGLELAPVVKDTLSVSADLLSLAPLPGIEEAAKALLNVWNACQKVDTNRLSCLRLAERCATLLYSVRCEINEAGMETALALDEPVEKLCGALAQIQTFLEMQLHRPFLKRYVRREETARELVACNEAITDAGSRFGISVQIRTYHEVCSMMKESKRSSQEVQALLALDHQIMQRYVMMCGQQQILARRGEEVVGNALGLTTYATPPPEYGPPSQPWSTTMSPLSRTNKPISTEPASGFDGNSPTLSVLSIGHTSDAMRADMSALPTPTPTRTTFVPEVTGTSTVTTAAMTEAESSHSIHPIHVLAQVHRAQDSEDAAADAAALRGTMVGALNAHNDLMMVRCLQVARGDIPEAAETLRRVLGAGAQVEMDKNVRVTADEVDLGAHAPNTELDRKFMQSGIEAMTRLTNVVTKKSGSEVVEASESAGSFGAPKLPSWTITRYEVTRTCKIGTNAYLGHWKKLPVIIKVLRHSVSRDAFVRHVELRNALDHPNVLPLYGASSTMGDKPWFFVSKFCIHGNLVALLRRARAERATGKDAAVRVDPLKSIHEIAKGMAYLHGRGVLHGNLMAANVLVDESGMCVLSGFGQSEIKLEGKPEPHPIWWWAPERLMGDGKPTYAADVYAFAICCVEILGMGDLPWATLDGFAIQELVLGMNERPPIPIIAGNAEVASAITNVVHSCWGREPDGRPSFATVASLFEDAYRLRDHCSSQIWEASTPPMNRSTLFTSSTESSPADELYETARESVMTEVEEESMDCMMDIPLTSPMPALGDDVVCSVLLEGVQVLQQALCGLKHRDRETLTPSPTTALIFDMRNEENYRLVMGLNHVFHSSLTLPLWSPTRVELGAIGYLSKPRGEFITLLNATDPLQSCEESLRRLPSLYGYGKFEVQRREDGKRSVAQRGLDAITGFLTFKTRGDRSYPERIGRQYTFPLVQGKAAAYLCVEKTVHRYMDGLEAPTMWFKQHVDLILEVYALRHAIRREDLILVIGTLNAPDWAVFVSEDHCDGRVQFNAFTGREKGEPWGVYTLERMVKSGNPGPARWVDMGRGTFASKVSCSTTCAQDTVGDTVMMAGLRFGQGTQVPMVM